MITLKPFLTACVLAALALAGTLVYAQSGQKPQPSKGANVPEPVPESGNLEKAMFGTGCFWGAQVEFDHAKGVKKTTVGYSGGTVKDPTYRQVCNGDTGHAEVVQVEFDPAVISYGELLDLFWKMHDPTQLNRQGPDVGSNYRSAIFYYSPQQKAAAEASKQAINSKGDYKGAVVTEIVAAGEFYPAEEYHQHYLKKKGIDTPRCHSPF